jgi:hypothetical protein
MVFRSDILKLILPSNGSLFSICADYYMAHFANLMGNSILIPTIHGCYRRHGKNNFGSHPVYGAINSVGDLSKHPPHKEFRDAIANHIIKNFKKFQAILNPKGLLIFFFKLLCVDEFISIAGKHRELFSETKTYYLKEYIRFKIKRYRIPKPFQKTIISFTEEVSNKYAFELTRSKKNKKAGSFSVALAQDSSSSLHPLFPVSDTTCSPAAQDLSTVSTVSAISAQAGNQ